MYWTQEQFTNSSSFHPTVRQSQNSLKIQTPSSCKVNLAVFLQLNGWHIKAKTLKWEKRIEWQQSRKRLVFLVSAISHTTSIVIYNQESKATDSIRDNSLSEFFQRCMRESKLDCPAIEWQYHTFIRRNMCKFITSFANMSPVYSNQLGKQNG